jgi:hypothetical protein
MNAVSDIAAASLESISDPLALPRLHTLRRTGRKAIRFSGWQMVEAVGAGEVGSMWYDLAIYRSDAEKIITELIARRRLMGERDFFRVEVFDTLAAASFWLESYACANDVPIPADLAADNGPMSSAVLQAVQLRQRISRIEDDYRSLLSDIFEVLDMTDSNPSEALADAAG